MEQKFNTKKSEAIDDYDRKILDVLIQNSRASLRQISKKTKIPLSSVHYRFNKLKEKVIKRFTIELNYDELGLKFKAYVLIKVNIGELKRKNKTQIDILKKIKTHPFVENVDIIAGDYDLIATVRCHSISEFKDFLFDFLHNIDFIENTKTLSVIYYE